MEKSGLEEVCQGKDEVMNIKEKNNEATWQLLEAKSQQLPQLKFALGDKDRELASVRERCIYLTTHTKPKINGELQNRKKKFKLVCNAGNGARTEEAVVRAEVSSNRKDATSRRKRSSAILTPRKIQLTRNTSVYASQTQLLVTQCENQTLKVQAFSI